MKIESMISYLGIEVNDVLGMAEQLTSELSGQSRTGFDPRSASASCHDRTTTIPARTIEIIAPVKGCNHQRPWYPMGV
jgi:hypothetical protein